MKNQSKNESQYQKVKLSTESVMTPAPVFENSVNRQIKSSPEQILDGSIDKPISRAHKDYDTDLARDNLENDIPAADIQDL